MIPFTEKTLVLIKPDAISRGLIGRIIIRFEEAGLKILGLKLLQPTLDQAEKHYPTTDAQLNQMGNKTLETYAKLGLDPQELLGTSISKEIGLKVHKWNADFLSSGPVVAIVLEGVHAVKKVRALCGKTMPIDAMPGTIRGDFSSSSPAVANLQQSAVYNLIHASDNENDIDEPRKEIEHWFKPEELVEYTFVQSSVMFKPT